MNAVHLIGRTTAEINTITKGDTTYARFTLAVYRKNDITDFIDCVAFGKNAEYLHKNVKKGEKVGLSGILATNNFTDKNGIKRKSVEVHVSHAEALFFQKSEEQETISEEASAEEE